MARCPGLALPLGLLLVALLGAACARVHPPLALPDLALGEPAFFPTLEAYTSAPIVGGNAVEILLNGEQIFPAMLEAIRGAERTITYAQQVWEDGPVATELATALAERCRAGVGVNVLLDPVGTPDMPAGPAAGMRRSGCHVAFFRPSPVAAWRPGTERNHRRILVVDGRVGFTGSSGIGRRWMGNGRHAGHWRQTDVRAEGPVVEYLQGAFAENWLEATGIVLGGDVYFPQPLLPRGPVYAQAVRSSPVGGGVAMYTTFLLAISSARRSVYITDPSFAVDETLRQALIAAVGRGVRVAVLIPGPVDEILTRHVSGRSLAVLVRAGVECYRYRPALLHARTMVVDGVWSTVGSTSLDRRSFGRNDELNLVIYSAAVAERLEAVFAEDLRHAERLTYRDGGGRGARWAAARRPSR